MNPVDAIKQILLQSGENWVLWFLALLSLASISIVIERWLVYRRLDGDLRSLAERLDAHLSKADFRAAQDELQQSSAIAAAIAAAGLRLSSRGAAAADKAMQSAVALSRTRLERGLAYLGTLGNNAPFIGLFGTVVGVIGAFEELGHGAPGHGTGAASSQVASQAVMANIAGALVATAVGIAVALPAVAFFNYFQRRIASMLAGSEVLSNLVLAYLSEHAPEQAE